MLKMKYVSIMIVSILIGAGAASVSFAQPLDGQIDVEINNYIGLVSPKINLENESDVIFQALPVSVENETYYRINDSLEIELDITDNSERENFIFSRSVFYSAFIFRMPKFMPLLGQFGVFKRMFPAFVPLNTVNIVNSSLGSEKTDVLEIPVNYSVVDAAGTEQMTLHLVAFGMIPGDVNGIDGVKVLGYKKITLNVTYELPQ